MSQRAWAFVELGVAVAGLEAGLWLVSGRDAEPAVLAIALALGGVAYLSHRRRRRAGTTPDAARVGPGRAWLEALGGAACLVALTAVWVAALREPYDELRFAFPPGGSELAVWILRRVVYAAAQQLLLQLFLVPVCSEVAASEPLGGLLAAGVFGAAHLPSVTLALLTAAAAWAWIALYRRGRRLAPLVATHALLWIAAFAIVPDRLSLDMQVGIQAVESAAHYRTLDSELGREILRRVCAPEYFAAQGGTEAGFVRALYRDVLGRMPSDDEVGFWLRRLRIESRTEVAKKFVVSDELARIRRETGGRYRFPYRR
ncbi:MAG TPA: DUF4214 domain-containing protein [Thermoanaerobaculaceae bacterium]|nr:DUF4214 domain-containing protein [Thermoanaerobaculaceae bacterium]